MKTECSVKVALFVPALGGGGAQRVMSILASGLSDKNVQVDLVLANAAGPYLRDIPSQVNVVDLKAGRILTSIHRLVFYLLKEKPSVMLSTVAHANVAALFAKRISGVSTKLLIRVENTISVATADENGLMSKILKYLIKKSYPWADGIVAPSQGVADDLIHKFNISGDLISVIYNPVVRPEIIQKAKMQVNHPWFEGGEEPVIISVGRLTRQKDYATLIQALSIVRKQQPARLIILGEGEDRNDLKNIIVKLKLEDYVDLAGFVDNPYAYMAKSDVFVLSSLWEGLPNTLIEAMAVGLPVVATDCRSGPNEILANGKYGWLSQTGSAISIADGILQALTSDTFPMPDKESMKLFQRNTSVDKYLKLLLAAS
ncbi:MAG: glycosyltransferase [Methylococcales bacterium]